MDRRWQVRSRTTLWILMLSTTMTSATTWYIDDDAAPGGDGSTWGTAFNTIQQGIDAAADGDTVLVGDGTYSGDGNRFVDIEAKTVILQSENGPDTTILNYENGDARLRFYQADGSVLDGFKFKRASTNTSVVKCIESEMDVRNCRFEGLAGPEVVALGVYDCSPLIENCDFDYEPLIGIEAINSGLEIVGCNFGFGLFNTTESGIRIEATGTPRITNCSFVSNYRGGLLLSSYGETRATPLITNCTFWQCTQTRGLECDGVDVQVTNCTFLQSGISSINNSNTTMTNCVIWDSSVNTDPGDPAPVITWSCVDGGFSGEGNIDAYPHFMNPNVGDFRLSQASPCRDMGDSSAVPAGVTTDFEGNPRILGTAVDMGAFEYAEGGYSAAYVDINAEPDGDGTSWESALDTIQEGVDIVVAGGTVFVADGTYTGEGNRDIDLASKSITVKSMNGPESCIIDCQGSASNQHRGFRIVDDFNIPQFSTPVLEGFTILNGSQVDTYGKGGAMLIERATPTIKNCRLVDNSAERGGGVYISDSLGYQFIDCVFSGNSTTEEAQFDGGAIGSQLSSGTLESCIFTSNSAKEGGAIFMDEGGTIVNCLFNFNNAYYDGGAIHGSPTIINSTIVYNGAGGFQHGQFWGEGGGVYGSPTVKNSIFWGNSAYAADSARERQLSGASSVTWSCISGGWTGQGNISTSPMFATGGYRLEATSPCRDTGNDSLVPAGVTTDLDGRTRFYGSVDMGAYEYSIPTGDWDVDGDVDLYDYAGFMQCFGSTETACINAFDIQNDGDVDHADLALFVPLITGPQLDREFE